MTFQTSKRIERSRHRLPADFGNERTEYRLARSGTSRLASDTTSIVNRALLCMGR
jgi:hypothetical protein